MLFSEKKAAFNLSAFFCLKKKVFKISILKMMISVRNYIDIHLKLDFCFHFSCF